MATKKRLIDSRYLTSQMYLICEVCQTENIFIDAIIDEIDNAPDVDAVEVVHGRIEEVEIVPNYMWKYRCSCCHSDAELWYKYCPNCGAKMDGERKDND